MGLKDRLQTHTNVLRYFSFYMEEVFEAYYNIIIQQKLNELNIFHLFAQKFVSFTGSHKASLIYYGLCLETVGYILNSFSRSAFSILNFISFYNAHTVYRQSYTVLIKSNRIF